MNEMLSSSNQESKQNEISLEQFQSLIVPSLVDAERQGGRTLYLQTLNFNPLDLTDEDMQMYLAIERGEELNMHQFRIFQDKIWKDSKNTSRENFSAYLRDALTRRNKNENTT